jgi:S-adenosylmethionine:tRNA-ribosyltransferase-isomerase (queuine synthetase)
MDLSNILVDKQEFKRERKHNAIKLPENLDQTMIPKYVGYYKECYNYEKKLYREFFKIEKHPLQKKNKVYISSKSNKLTILEKLEQIKKILEDLNNNGEKIENNGEKIENNGEKIENKIKLPKYISLKKHEKDNNKYYIIYDKKTYDSRITLKTICSKLEPFSQNLEIFLEKIENKFNNLNENM